jgi:Spy/CpxP family protein refolding chaperone
MRHLVRPLLPLLVGVVVLAFGLLAQAQPPKSKAPGPQFGGGMGMMGMQGMSGLGLLSSDQVQRQLNLTEEQRKSLGEIGRKYMTQWRERMTSLQDLSPEERPAKMAELQKQAAKQAQDARKEAEAVLSPQQLDQLREITFRRFAQMALANPRLLDQVEATEEQKGQLRKLSEELQDKINKLQQETVDSALKVLTPEQQKKLRDMQTAGGPGF